MKEIPGYSGYYATDEGLIYSFKNGTVKEKTQRLDTKGYLRVNLIKDGCPSRKKSINVHTAVLLAFVGDKPAGMECRHLNGNCLDNHLKNLCWGTRQENVQDEIRHGTAACLRKGGKSNGAKLHTTDIYAIVQLYKLGYLQKEIADAFFVSQRHISDIVNQKTWVHLWGRGGKHLDKL